MSLIQFYPCSAAFFRYALDWSHINMYAKHFKGSSRLYGAYYSHNAASLTEPVEDSGSIRTFFQAGGLTEIFSVDICSAKQVNKNISVDRTLS
jgi:hypothetical protein